MKKRYIINLILLIGGLPLWTVAQPLGSSKRLSHYTNPQSLNRGEWMAEFRPDTGIAHLMIHRQTGGSDKRYFRLALYRLQGLTQAMPLQENAALKFQLKRDAGTFLFEGIFKGGNGSGNYTFQADPTFRSRMRALGYDPISPEDQLLMAVHDIGPSLVEDLKSLRGGSLSFAELISLGREGVNSEYIRELRTAGIEPTSVREVVELRAQGVSEDFVRAIEALGYARPTAEELIRMRWLGVSVDFIKQIEALGYKHPPLKKLTEMKFQGVNVDFIKKLEAIGYKNPPIDEMLGMKLFGVTPDFITGVAALGYRGLTIDQLTCLRIQGITLDFIHRMKDREKRGLSLRELVKLRNPNGISKGSCQLQTFPDKLPD